jgi:hypothetical protein
MPYHINQYLKPNSNSKSKLYLYWQRSPAGNPGECLGMPGRRRLPQRMYKYASLPPPCRLDIGSAAHSGNRFLFHYVFKMAANKSAISQLTNWPWIRAILKT